MGIWLTPSPSNVHVVYGWPLLLRFCFATHKEKCTFSSRVAWSSLRASVAQLFFYDLILSRKCQTAIQKFYSCKVIFKERSHTQKKRVFFILQFGQLKPVPLDIQNYHDNGILTSQKVCTKFTLSAEILYGQAKKIESRNRLCQNYSLITFYSILIF